MLIPIWCIKVDRKESTWNFVFEPGTCMRLSRPKDNLFNRRMLSIIFEIFEKYHNSVVVLKMGKYLAHSIPRERYMGEVVFPKTHGVLKLIAFALPIFSLIEYIFQINHNFIIRALRFDESASTTQ